jgi:hypothetical protein
MSKRTSSAATSNGGAVKETTAAAAASEISSEPGEYSPRRVILCQTWSGRLTRCAWGLGYDKQKNLLSNETGHFSLIRALHLADLITELNGTSSEPCVA